MKVGVHIAHSLVSLLRASRSQLKGKRRSKALTKKRRMSAIMSVSEFIRGKRRYHLNQVMRGRGLVEKI